LKQKERQANIKNASNILRLGYRNTLKCSHGGAESLHHKIVKFWVANFCWENGLQFWSEASFTSGGRADLLIGDWNVAVEVLHTEKFIDCRRKDYPVPTLVLSSNIDGTRVNEILTIINGYDEKKEVIEHFNKFNKEQLSSTPWLKREIGSSRGKGSITITGNKD
jgi:hypothetical protein